MRLLILTEKEKRGIHHFRFTVLRLKSLLRYRSDIYVQSEDGIIRVYYPEQDDFAEEMMQNIGKYASIENYHLAYKIVEDAQLSENTVKWKVSGLNQITVFQKLLLPLQAVFPDTDDAYWLYSHYINIYYCRSYFLQYTDENAAFDLFDSITADFYQFGDSNRADTFQDAIRRGHYIYIWIDNFHNSTSRYYHNRYEFHDVHPILIYGYDRGKGIYYCVGFDIMKGLTFDEIKIEEVHRAFESARIYSQLTEPGNAGRFLKPRNFGERFPCAETRFLKELFRYMHSFGDAEQLHLLFGGHHNRIRGYYGLDVTRELIEGLQNSEYPHYDYRLFHLIVENKQHILRSIRFHIKESSSELDEKVTAYEQLVKEYEIQRNVYLKTSMIENEMQSFYPKPKNEIVCGRIAKRMTELVAQEEALLRNLFVLLTEALLDGHYIERGTVRYKNRQLRKAEGGEHIVQEWEKPITTKCVELYSMFPLFEGTFQFSDGTSADIRPHGSVDCFYSITFPPKQITWVKYYPKAFVGGDDSLFCISVCQNNLLYSAKIIPSSVFSERNDISFAPENVLHNDQQTFWTPEVFDRERSLEFVLPEKQCISRVFLDEIHTAARITGYRFLFYCEAEDRWKCLAEHEGEFGTRLHHHRFTPVITQKIKLVVTGTVMDETGYDIPHVAYVGAFAAD